MWCIKYAAKWTVLILVLTAWSLAMIRVGQSRALKTYEGWMEDYRIERMAIDKANAEADPEEIKIKREAECIARALYGIRENSTDDLKTYCWCILNRVDHAGFPNTVEAVVNQPSQWVRYSPGNPVVKNLYDLAREQVEAWHNDHRRVSPDYVFMSWTPTDICLRDAWQEGSGTHYWRYGR